MDYSDPGVIRLFSFLNVPLPPPDNICWEWKGKGSATERPRISFKGKSVSAHRLFYELFKGPVAKGLCILHSCDNWRCCNPAHLYPGTQQDNMNDACARLTGGFKIPPEEAIKIKQGYYTCEEVVTKFNVHRMTYYNIRAGRVRAKL